MNNIILKMVDNHHHLNMKQIIIEMNKVLKMIMKVIKYYKIILNINLLFLKNY